jgi:hypothetical protein
MILEFHSTNRVNGDTGNYTLSARGIRIGTYSIAVDVTEVGTSIPLDYDAVLLVSVAPRAKRVPQHYCRLRPFGVYSFTHVNCFSTLRVSMIDRNTEIFNSKVKEHTIRLTLTRK